ncbi:MAG: hypothetical protein H6813_06120 [Phycisphaeraceae bacterium]|nr:hypothetical protein [Phycisphaeraceae bacterium]MCB9848046.1 hypothetical protein [Phycisphaeraceae bacterium]
MVVMWFAFAASLVWRRAATALLLVVGLFVLVGYPIAASPQFPVSTIIFVMATLGLPPLAAGALLWRRRGGKRQSNENADGL